MPTNVVKTKEDELLWSTAKRIAEKEYGTTERDGDLYWAVVMGIFKKLKEKLKRKRKKK